MTAAENRFECGGCTHCLVPLIFPLFVLETQWCTDMSVRCALFITPEVECVRCFSTTASVCHSAGGEVRRRQIVQSPQRRFFILNLKTERGSGDKVLKVKLSSISASSTKTEPQHRVLLTVHLLNEKRCVSAPSPLHRFDSSFLQRPSFTHHRLDEPFFFLSPPLCRTLSLPSD